MKDDDLIRAREELGLVRDEDARAASKEATRAKDLTEDVLAYVCVHRGERVVEEDCACARVARTREGDARLLPAAQVDPLLPDLRQVAARKDLQVGEERARGEDPLVKGIVHRRAEEDVAADGVVENEGGLRKVSSLAFQAHLTLRLCRRHGCRLLDLDGVELALTGRRRGRQLRGGLQLAEECAQERRLARAHSARNHCQLPMREGHIELVQRRAEWLLGWGLLGLACGAPTATPTVEGAAAFGRLDLGACWCGWRRVGAHHRFHFFHLGNVGNGRLSFERLAAEHAAANLLHCDLVTAAAATTPAAAATTARIALAVLAASTALPLALSLTLSDGHLRLRPCKRAADCNVRKVARVARRRARDIKARRWRDDLRSAHLRSIRVHTGSGDRRDGRDGAYLGIGGVAAMLRGVGLLAGVDRALADVLWELVVLEEACDADEGRLEVGHLGTRVDKGQRW